MMKTSKQSKMSMRPCNEVDKAGADDNERRLGVEGNRGEGNVFDRAAGDDRHMASGVEGDSVGRNEASHDDISKKKTRVKAGPSKFTPEQLRPFPKAEERKSKKGGRKRAKTLILTDTPIKNNIEQEFEAKKVKKALKIPAKPQESESEISEEPVLNDTSDDDLDDFADFNENVSKESIKKGVHVLVRYERKKSVVHYVGIVTDEVLDYDLVPVKFFKRKLSSQNKSIFIFPDKDDIDEIEIADIVMLLQPPFPSGGTKRTAQSYIFSDLDFANCKIE